jgi:hypothetical protein
MQAGLAAAAVDYRAWSAFLDWLADSKQTKLLENTAGGLLRDMCNYSQILKGSTTQ